MQILSLVQLNKQPRNYFARLIQHSPTANFQPTSEVYILHLRKRQRKHYFIILKHYTLMFQSTLDSQIISKEDRIFWKRRNINGTKKYLLDLKRNGAPLISLAPIEL
jgi:hypothetical protein